MFKLFRFALFFVTIFFYYHAMAQTTEQQIRQLDNAESEAVRKGDTATLAQLWSPQLLVNNPANAVIAGPQVLELIRQGKIKYDGFVKVIEKVAISGNVAVVMGQEEMKSQVNTDHAGKAVKRRFTNVWMLENGNWRLLARQATITSVE